METTGQTTPPIRILIADDHPMMRMGVKDLLTTQKRFEVVGEAASADEALNLARTLRPDVVLMDISMPGTSGLEATALLRSEFPEVKVIVLTMYEDREYIRQFVRSGADGYVLKLDPPHQLVQAIESVWRGKAFFSPEVSQVLLEEQRSGIRKDAFDTLTNRERQVLCLIARGSSTKAIADKLFVSPRTVSKHREAIAQKLNLHSIAELTQYAISQKLIEVKRP